MTSLATISAPVGMGPKAVNRQPDVKAIQRLLNGVAQADGGPRPELLVDGVCGKKTQAAIQQFQLRHFGWKLADGRVDPAGQTLARMIQLSSAVAAAGEGVVHDTLPPGIPGSAIASSRPGPAWTQHASVVSAAGTTAALKSHPADKPSNHWSLYSVAGAGIAGPLGGTVLYFRLQNRTTRFYYAAYALLFSPGIWGGVSVSIPSRSDFSIAGGRSVTVDEFDGRKVDCWALEASLLLSYTRSRMRFYGLATVPHWVDLSGFAGSFSTPYGGFGGSGKFHIS